MPFRGSGTSPETMRCAKLGERVLVTVLTKKMAEDLTDYLAGHGVKVRYLHSDIDTVERMEIIRDLRLGVFDVLVGINLLREGLDIPEVSLVAILDADKEGFLRSERSLIQTMGRAARNLAGKAVLYADRITGSMQRAIDETERRRAKQIAYNELHGITPTAIKKKVSDVMDLGQDADLPKVAEKIKLAKGKTPYQLQAEIKQLEQKMLQHAKDLEFELAAQLRDQIHHLREALLEI